MIFLRFEPHFLSKKTSVHYYERYTNTGQLMAPGIASSMKCLERSLWYPPAVFGKRNCPADARVKPHKLKHIGSRSRVEKKNEIPKASSNGEGVPSLPHEGLGSVMSCPSLQGGVRGGAHPKRNLVHSAAWKPISAMILKLVDSNSISRMQPIMRQPVR